MVIFDVEGTLFDNRPRVVKILQEYGVAELKVARPQYAQTIANLTPKHIQFELAETLKSIGIIEEPVVNNASVFWSQRFFTDEYLKYDAANAGAVRFIRDLYSKGARIVYVTGRDAQRQLVGTTQQLRDAGFPIGIQNTEIVMRPTAQTQEAAFKQQITNYLRQSGKVLATFETEAAYANVYRKAFPDAVGIIYEAPHAANPPALLEGIISLAAFE